MKLLPNKTIRFLTIIFFISLLILYNCRETGELNKISGGQLPDITQIDRAIDRGNFTEAKELIRKLKCSSADLPDTTEIALDFRLALMKRIKLDFNKDIADIKEELSKYYPRITARRIAKWENKNVLEMRVIDGEKCYFHNAVANLFRLDSNAMAVKTKIDGKKESRLDQIKLEHTARVLDEYKSSGKNLLHPVEMRINYRVEVEPNVTPAGEVIRCWMPFPRTSRDRQQNIKLISTNIDNYIIAPDKYKQRSIYMEKTAKKDQPTIFTYEFKYTSMAEYHDMETIEIPSYDKNSKIYKKYTRENPPHIVFSDRIKKLTDKLVGDETDPYQKVKKIYTWIDNNIPWASAREYSTFRNIPKYVLDRMHGDCGMQTFLFITMARYAGIPAKWQSGWMMHPGEVNLHDWSEVYYPELGWIPVDQDFSLQKTDDKKLRNYYTSGIDAYRLIVNDAFSKEFYPQKIHPRSETLDFQRGEVEWRGGNIYFNKWDYDMDVEYIKGSPIANGN